MSELPLHLSRDDFNLSTLDDELRVDALCAELLRSFHGELLAQGVPPLEAGSLAQGADYYLRDFLVAVKQRNLLAEERGLVRQFAATWYIISTIDPELKILAQHLAGVREFYCWLGRKGALSHPFIATVEEECADLDYYGRRIESFWQISGDGYYAWERECPLKSRQ
ncbi:MAG TPA: hypothetical protein VFR01_01145 [Geobacterales bacterium]|nr:hypothetical protein [Geobacterales bacterium]